jgi:hypothetical protein
MKPRMHVLSERLLRQILEGYRRLKRTIVPVVLVVKEIKNVVELACKTFQEGKLPRIIAVMMCLYSVLSFNIIQYYSKTVFSTALAPCTAVGGKKLDGGTVAK